MDSSAPIERIRGLGQQLAALPYENLSKRSSGRPRTPDEVMKNFDRQGLGGTCFSLVRLAHELALQRNLRPAYYLGDRPTGENHHCVLGFPEEGVFLDPGYLTYEPVPMHPEKNHTMVRPFNTLVLRPEPPARLRVETRRKGQNTWRFTLKLNPVSEDRFESVWRSSFGWKPVMESRVITRRTRDGMLVYLNGRLESITREQRSRLTVPPEATEIEVLARHFNLDETWLRKRLGRRPLTSA